MIFNFLSVLGLVVLNGFFVATEFALVSVRRSRVEEIADSGRFGARQLQKALKNLDHYIAGTQVGITLASLALGWIGEPAIARTIEPLFKIIPVIDSPALVHTVATVIAFLCITFLHVVLGELVPKSLALQYPEKISLAVCWPMAAIVIVLQPLIWSLNGIGNSVLRLIGVSGGGAHHNVHSVEELEILVKQSHEAGVIDDLEQEILQRTFRLGELTAGDVMIRRVDMVALDLERPVEELLGEVADTIHSRIPVYSGSLDSIIGILHVHDLFREVHRAGMPTELRSLCRQAFVVPKGIHLDSLLEFFQQQRTQIAIVVDEYGGTAGMVTYEDIVEEVTGEVQDELEASEPSIERLPDKRILLRGDLRIDEVNSALGWDLQDDTVDTLAGLIMNRLGRVARVDDEVDTVWGILKVIDMARMRITRVAALPKPEAKSDAAETDKTSE